MEDKMERYYEVEDVEHPVVLLRTEDFEKACKFAAELEQTAYVYECDDEGNSACVEVFA